ncbi:MAG TPA: penicillin-binding protein 2 [Burkholderiales bacterium]|nr:penicillin-binding protein 2 [Burkholderiales bacterium]
MTRHHDNVRRFRRAAVLFAVLAGFVALGARAVYLQIMNAQFLQSEGNARHSRVVKDNSHRGMILDRHGSPLAVSTPVDSVWAHPDTLAREKSNFWKLGQLLGSTSADVGQLVKRHDGREFMYLKRHVTPETAERVKALEVPGVALLREYRRYYPLGPVAGHVVGFTNIDDQGQEGIELAYDAWLRATPGIKRVLKDPQGSAMELIESLSLPVAGKDLVLSLDRRIQYLAYRELKAAVATHHARSGAAIVLDAHTGEILALVNEPDFNPNNRAGLKSQAFRNRAVTDTYEPGSTLKPFTVAAALESGRFRATTPIDTAPGTVRVGDRLIRDTHNYGTLTVSGVIEKSSNVGASKIALALTKQSMWDVLQRAGFGQLTGVALPGEVSGVLRSPSRWVPVEQAALSYGYGMSVTPLQLARAYGAIANGGIAMPLTMIKRDTAVDGRAVMSPAIASQLRTMIEAATSPTGTGVRAQVADYRIAGKTGTVRKLTPTGYSEEQYLSWFAGFAPVSDPRLVMVVMVDEPRGGSYYGGDIAAPVFGRVMTGALRLLDIRPDAPRLRSPSLIAAQPAAGGA